MSTPCVCRGGLTPCCCAHTRGGRRGAKQRSNSPARTSTLHAKRGDVQATRRQGGNGPVLRACPNSHAPALRWGTSELQVNAAHRTKQQQSKGKARGTAVHAPASTPLGVVQAQDSAHIGPGQRHDEAMG